MRQKRVKTGGEIIVQIASIDKLPKTKYPPGRGLWTFFVAMVLFFTSSCQQSLPESRLEKVISSGVLRVGIQYGITTYYNGSVSPQGFEYEMAKGFAEHLGVMLEVYPYYSPKELYTNIQQGNIDIIASNILVTPENRVQFKFSPAYQTISHKLVYLQGKTRPRDFSQLQENIVMAADSGDSHLISKLQEIASLPENKNWELVLADDRDELELIESVIDGEIQYTLVDSNLLSLARRKYPELSIAFTVKKDTPVAWALPKHDDDSILSALIEYFGTIKQNGVLLALEDKYFGHVRQFNYVDTTLFLKAAKEKLPQYRSWFEQYSGDVDWRLMAAMSYQESHWNPKAKSPTGVRGMMMLTLPTARDWKVKSRLDPEQSIRGGSNYFNSLLRRVPARIQYPDRVWFALAAYNIGLGHLEDARILTQTLGANPDLWVDVKKHLPLLRQKRYYKRTRYGYARGNEAVTYVANIRRYYDSLAYLYAEEDTASELASAN